MTKGNISAIGKNIKSSLVSLSVDYSRDRRILWIFLSPALVILLFANVYPVCYALYMSFFDFNRNIPGAVPEFYGIRNFIEILTDTRVINAIIRTVVFVGATVVVELALGMIIAVLITQKLRGMEYLRGFFLVPMMMTPVVAGTLWRTLFNTSYGPINYFLGLLKIPQVEWLSNPNSALPSIMMVEVWEATPVIIFILAAGIQSLPVDIYKQAQVDGASAWYSFRRITLPLLKPVIAVALLLRIMDAFKVFDTIYVMTWGGPGTTTELISMYIYQTGLKYLKIGKASALSVIFLVLIFLISINFLRQIQRRGL